MGRKKLPKNVHILNGTAKKNPKRMRARGNEPEITKHLGNPPRWLNKEEKAAWREIKKQCIEGVLGFSDRIAVEMASRLLVKCRGLAVFEGVVIEASASEQKLLQSYLASFGMSPADRTKINLTPIKPKSVFDD